MKHYYIINSDEELFLKFKEMESRLSTLSSYFQNPQITLTEEEMEQWNRLSVIYKEDIENLFHDCNSKILFASEREDKDEKELEEFRREYYNKFIKTSSGGGLI